MKKLENYISCPSCKSPIIYKLKLFRCVNCGVNYPIKEGILILVKASKQQEILDKWNQDDPYKSLHKKRTTYNKMGYATTPKIIELIRNFNSENQVVLDVACGSGLYTRYFKGTVISFDIVPYFIKKIEKKYKSKNRFFIIADVNDFPFQNNLDFIFASQIVEHLERDESNKLLKRMIKSSNINVLVDTPNESNLFLNFIKKFIFYKKTHNKNEYHLDHHNKVSIEDFKKYNYETHSCVGFVTRRTIKLNIFWNLYDKLAWHFPSIGGNLVGIYKKNN